jgi:hypothetical protein
MDECLLTQGPEAASSELWDEVVAMRVKVEDCKKRLQVIYYLCHYHVCCLWGIYIAVIFLFFLSHYPRP